MSETRRAKPRRAREPWSAKRERLTIIGAAIATLLFVMAVPAIFVATEQPAFCTSCHEMDPYYTAHATAAHKDVSCVDCHVDPGVVSHVSHKFVAAKELVDHFTTQPLFPQGTAEVPNSRCIQCHKSLPKTATGFDHALHTAKLSCIKCHADAGHKVTTQSLAAAGVLNPKALSTATGSATLRLASTVTTASMASSSDPSRTVGHKAVSCDQCHAPGTMRCSQCHTPKHAARGECTTCHSAAVLTNAKAFAFIHPTSTACENCHKPKHPRRGSCTLCHAAGTTWSFTHPAGKPVCTTCHQKPAKGHALRNDCRACHTPGTPFAKTSFSHGGSPVCTRCHARPSNHSSKGCGTCHKAGTSWAFRHPSSRSCSSCHSAPGGHYGSSCGNCHEAGTTWKGASVNHRLVSSDCANCHNPPSNHYGSSCSSCHRWDRAFKKAYVSHRILTGGCSKCHRAPSGHRSGSCTTCHRQKGSSWKFTHPSSRSCASCHRAPGGHYGSNCASCHKKAGSTWKGAHPSSGSCSSCHSAPSGHYGTNCASCHVPLKAWSSATFRHPSTGGPHTSRTWPCAKCHPSGPPAAVCTCHKNGTAGD